MQNKKIHFSKKIFSNSGKILSVSTDIKFRKKFMFIWTSVVKHNKAFTLVEVMIALLVFWIWLVTVLGMVVYNITLSDNIKSQVSWTLLAKEWIEIIYNVKESNKKKDFAWNILSITKNSTDDYTEGQKFDLTSPDDNKFRVGVSFDENKWFWRYQVEKLPSDTTSSVFLDDIKLYYNPVPSIPSFSWYYSHFKDSNSKNTFFSRYVDFSGVNKIPGEDEENTDKITKITSHVLINKWRKREIKIETFMWNN